MYVAFEDSHLLRDVILEAVAEALPKVLEGGRAENVFSEPFGGAFVA